MTAGRSCPLSYRYSPAVFRDEATVKTEVLYVVGGLYGNEPALAAVLEAFTAEKGPKHLIFNGDFNWFNIDPNSFSHINHIVLSFDAIRGNVETELASLSPMDDDAGCGCAYPDWVDDDIVQRSNTIMQRLKATASEFPQLQQKISRLPMWKRIDVAGCAVGIVHGDAQSLAGWGFAAESMAEDMHLAQVRQWFDTSGVRVFACSHTCSTVFQPIDDSQGRECMVANNGAAGMPNFLGLHDGVLTRIASTPYRGGDVHHRRQIGDVFIEALPIRYDRAQWHADFLKQWPIGSPAHTSYWKRISEGPPFRIEQAFKTGVS